MGSLSIWHWLILLLVVVLVFGTKKLRNIGTDVGGAVKGFKEAMKAENDKSQPKPEITATADGHTIEGEVKKEPQSKS